MTGQLALLHQAKAALRTVRALVTGYLALSVLTLAVVAALRNHPSIVTDAVWVRTVIVVASAALMMTFVARAAQGRARAYLRLRLVSAIMLVAIAVILAVPGDFPLWLKLEQAVCGVLLLAVVIVVNGKHLRDAFAGR